MTFAKPFLNDWQLNAYAPIPSLLSEQVIDSIWGFIRCLEAIATDLQFSSNTLDETCLKTWILEAIRRVSQTEQVLHIQYVSEQQEWRIIAHSQTCLGEKTSQWVLDTLQDIPIHFWNDYALKDSPQGIYRVLPDGKTEDYTAYGIVPISGLHSCLMIIGLSVQQSDCGYFQSPFLNDQFTYIATNFYTAACEFYHPQSGSLRYQLTIIESSILDTLKFRYGFVPKRLYERRFELFKYSLAAIEIHFEPIFDLEKNHVFGWEALARNPITEKAPFDLFSAAELWGLQFTLELDLTLCKKTVHTYVRLLRSNQSPNYPLFVNVYPESLMMDEYFNLVKSLTTGSDAIISPQCITLEISEKKKLPFSFQDPRSEISLEAFQQRLIQYVKQLGIQFSLDDFGVGYSSVHRFTGLGLPYVKIDREILHQKPFDAVIRFVKEVIKYENPESSSEIIIEGVDSASPISLQHLKSLGIRFVQGYLIGEASAELIDPRTLGGHEDTTHLA